MNITTLCLQIPPSRHTIHIIFLFAFFHFTKPLWPRMVAFKVERDPQGRATQLNISAYRHPQWARTNHMLLSRLCALCSQIRDNLEEEEK